MPLMRFDKYTEKNPAQDEILDDNEITKDPVEPILPEEPIQPEPIESELDAAPIDGGGSDIEKVLDTPEVKITINVEVKEGKILKFNECGMNDIYTLLKTKKYADSNYFLRKKGADLHIVKFNEGLKLDLNRFVDSLFKFYGTTKNLSRIVEGVKIKGNAKFSIIEKLNPKFEDKVINDIIMLLSKKGV